MKSCYFHITKNRIFVKGDSYIKTKMTSKHTTLKVSNISMTLSLALNLLISTSSAEKDDFQSLSALQFKECSTGFYI